MVRFLIQITFNFRLKLANCFFSVFFVLCSIFFIYLVLTIYIFPTFNLHFSHIFPVSCLQFRKYSIVFRSKYLPHSLSNFLQICLNADIFLNVFRPSSKDQLPTKQFYLSIVFCDLAAKTPLQ